MSDDPVTMKAFSDLWRLWKAYHEIGDDPGDWMQLLAEVRGVIERSGDAEDPEFIFSFGTAVMESLDRISRRS